MADSGIVLEVPRAGPDVTTRILEAAFVVFLLLVFVGLQPFATRDPNALAINGETIAAGEGDLIRQITYLFAFAVIGFCAAQRFGVRALDAIPISLVLLLLWCGLSAFWSPEPAITIRRVGLEVVVVLSVMLGMNALGAERSLKLLCYVLALVLIVNWISIPILPHQAIHQPDEVDPSIVGDWRGLYFQKNITGAVCAVSAMVFLYHAIREKKWIYWALLIGTLGFLVMTRSKSSMGLLPLGIVAAAVYRWGWRREIDRVIVSVAGILLLVAAGLALALYSDQLAHVLSDPAEFTGRAAIWQAEIGFIRDHALLGSGFGSFADTGDLSPLHNYVGENWVQEISHRP